MATLLSITACDAQRLPRTVGGDTFAVELKNESDESEDKVTAEVQDKGHGNYLVTYTIPRSVRLRGAHIQGSPFTVSMASSLRRKVLLCVNSVCLRKIEFPNPKFCGTEKLVSCFFIFLLTGTYRLLICTLKRKKT